MGFTSITDKVTLCQLAGTGDLEYPPLGWYVLQHETGRLHLPLPYASHIDVAVLTALGVDCTYEVGIVGQEEDGTTSEAEIFNAREPLKFDVTYRLYLITGVTGCYPSVRDLPISGAFHEPREVGGNAEADSRTGASFANQMHKNAFEFLMFAATPKSLPGKPTTTVSAFLRCIRDFKKNVKRRYIILKGHLVYLAGERRRKNIVRAIRVRMMHPHGIVPFTDEIDQVRQHARVHRRRSTNPYMQSYQTHTHMLSLQQLR